jgi:YHS domain-containing protein
MKATALGIALLIITSLGFAPQTEKSQKPKLKGDPYPLAICIVSGQKLPTGGKAVVKEIDGREVRFCCENCVAKFEGDKATFGKRLDDKIIETQLPHYPLKTCLVMEDEVLDEPEHKAQNVVHQNRLVRFCCRKCAREFSAEPDKYLKKLDAAVIEQQRDSYPLTTCPVSGEKLDDGAVNKVYGVSLVRFCCNDCVAKFEAEPATYMAKVHEAWIAKGQGKHDDHAHDHDHGHDHKH